MSTNDTTTTGAATMNTSTFCAACHCSLSVRCYCWKRCQNHPDALGGGLTRSRWDDEPETPTRTIDPATATRVTVPATFWDDHVSRDGNAGQVLRSGARTVTVLLDAAGLADLASDAAYYAGLAADDVDGNDDLRRIIRSAKATVRTLAKTRP